MLRHSRLRMALLASTHLASVHLSGTFAIPQHNRTRMLYFRTSSVVRSGRLPIVGVSRERGARLVKRLQKLVSR